MAAASHADTEPLTIETIGQRLAALRGGEADDGFDMAVVEDDSKAEGFSYYQPFEQAANEYAEFSRTAGRRILTGITEFDGAMRGVAPKELCLVVGHAHSGKSLFLTQMLSANSQRRIALFTPDETRVLILVKLACAREGVSAEYLEHCLSSGDPWAEEVLRATARDHFPNLAVFDEISSLDVMSKALDECRVAWDGEPEAVIIDYADLVQTGADDTAGKINAIKAWGKAQDVPLFLAHQTSRSAGADGKKLTISSGSYGGEQQATFVVGVRRKKNQYQAAIDELEARIATATRGADSLADQLADARYLLGRHANTVTFSLVKNKRPPSRLIEDTDFRLDPDSGRIERFDSPAPTAEFTQLAAGEEPF